MKVASKISLAVFAAALLALGTWGFVIFKNRATDPKRQTEENSQIKSKDENGSIFPSFGQDSREDTSVNNDQPMNQPQENGDDTDETIEKDTFLEITNKDCDNQCKNFKNDQDYLKYCQNYCGLSPTNKKAESCEAIDDGLEQDYCFKDEALNKQDLKICQKIVDTNIKKSCENRILEDLTEKQVLQ